MPTGLLFAALVLLLSCPISADAGDQPGVSGSTAMAKIRFDLSVLDDNGLYGPPNGLRALHYEFCIPATEAHAEQVSAINPSLEIMRGSRGRIGCTEEQYLCVGSTHQPGFRDVLARLAELPYIERIEQSFAE
jgi:hypothetical protein